MNFKHAPGLSSDDRHKVLETVFNEYYYPHIARRKDIQEAREALAAAEWNLAQGQAVVQDPAMDWFDPPPALMAAKERTRRAAEQAARQRRALAALHLPAVRDAAHLLATSRAFDTTRRQLKGRGAFAPATNTVSKEQAKAALTPLTPTTYFDKTNELAALAQGNELPSNHPYVSTRTLENGQPLPPTVEATIHYRNWAGEQTLQRTMKLAKEKSPVVVDGERLLSGAAAWLGRNYWVVEIANTMQPLTGKTFNIMNTGGDSTDYGTPPGFYFESLTEDGDPDFQPFMKYGGTPLECAGLFPSGELKSYQAPMDKKGGAGFYIIQSCKRDLAKAWGEHDAKLNERALEDAELARVKNAWTGEREYADNIIKDKGLPNTNRYAFIRAYGWRAEYARGMMDRGQWAYFTQLSEQTGNSTDLIIAHMKAALDAPDAIASMEPNGTTERGPFIRNPSPADPPINPLDEAFQSKFGMTKDEAKAIFGSGNLAEFYARGLDPDLVALDL